MAMTALHRFTRRLLWRVAGMCAALLVAAWLLGAGTVWQIVEWIPMTVAIALVARTSPRSSAHRRQRGSTSYAGRIVMRSLTRLLHSCCIETWPVVAPLRNTTSESAGSISERRIV